MRGKTYFLSILFLVTLIAASCVPGLQPILTKTPLPPTTAPTNTSLPPTAAPTSTQTDTPDPTLQSSPAANEPYSPHLEIRDVALVENRLGLTICFDLPSARFDWTMGRLYGDVYLYDGNHTVILSGFTLASPFIKSESPVNPHCDRTQSVIPADFRVEQATLTVKRIAASFNQNEIDWDTLLREVESMVLGAVLEQIPDGFSVVETPPGMTALEVHDLVVGMMEPVFIGPWSVPIQADSE